MKIFTIVFIMATFLACKKTQHCTCTKTTEKIEYDANMTKTVTESTSTSTSIIMEGESLAAEAECSNGDFYDGKTTKHQIFIQNNEEFMIPAEVVSITQKCILTNR